MKAEELRTAVGRVVQLLEKSGVSTAVREYRAAPTERRSVAAARIGHAGAMITAGTDKLSGAERDVLRALHLESLASRDYWDNLLEADMDARETTAAFVHLQSRVMFASSHLPALLSLLGNVNDVPIGEAPVLNSGEAALVIRLADAGERATDPDRIARSIDGIDMLYCACASIARKPAMDLRLEHIDGNRFRDLHFVGESDSLSAVAAVVGSIPAVLNAFDDSEELDLERVAKALPIFNDLQRLGQFGTFNQTDLDDISETMLQGVLLALESGVILIANKQDASVSTLVGHDAAKAEPAQFSEEASSDAQLLSNRRSAFQPVPGSAAVEPDDQEDEHYQRYLREREAMLDTPIDGLSAAAMDEQRRRDAVAELLESLGRARSEPQA